MKDERSKSHISNDFFKLIMNQHLISFLENEIQQILFTETADKTNNSFRIRHLKRTITWLSGASAIEIKNMSDAKHIPNCGKGTLERIQRFLKLETANSSVASSSFLELDPKIVAIKSLMAIHGIGIETARDLVAKNILSPTQLIDSVYYQRLSYPTKVCLKYHEDLVEKIPRDEITAMKVLLEQFCSSKDFEICGSFRRLKSHSSDIDVLLKIDTSKNINVKILVETLHRSGIMCAYLTSLTPTSKFMGICKIRDKYRRIDIMPTTCENWATSLLHFTGSADFNIKTRIKAAKLGYKLSEHGLYKIANDSTKSLTRVPVFTEEDIFTALEMEYISPEKR